MSGKLEGRIAIVTGGARGQGAGVAKTFADEGAAVAVLDVLDEQGAATVDAIESSGGTALYIHCDVGSEDSVAGAVDTVVGKLGRIDVLYNNAAVIAYGRKIAEMSADDWDRTIAVNLRGPFLCSKYALPHIVAAGGGSIINLSSFGAVKASPVGIADYGTSKGGIESFTYYLASEYGADHVRANCIAPGPVPTDLTGEFLRDEGMRRAAASMIPLGRVGSIDDIARAALFLASDDSKWISGTVLRVDGGMVVQ